MDAQSQFRVRIHSPKAPKASPGRRTLSASLLICAGAFGLVGTTVASSADPSEATAESNSALLDISADRIQGWMRSAFSRLDAQLAPHDTAYTASPAASPAPVGRTFGIGDRLKISVYERVDVEDDKWGRTSSAMRGIQQRPEMSGEYTVQEDGTISVPLIGAVPVAARGEQQVETALGEAFAQTLGRKGMVNVLLLERSPVYVLGPVKNPGSFKYVPGMTVLHAIALAGGLERDTGDAWQKIETVREVQKRRGAVDAMLKLLARAAVLKAERDGTTPKIPVRMQELVGPTESANLIDEQSDRRKAVAMAHQERERTALRAVESAKQDLQMYTHTDSLDDLVRRRQERVESTRALVERNVLSKMALSQVQGDLSDAEQRRREAFNQFSIAKDRVASLEGEALRMRSEFAIDLAVGIEDIERQISDNEREFDASEGVLHALPATRVDFGSKEPGRYTYRIVRQTANGPVGIDSGGMAVLQPGDLVNIVQDTGASAPPEPGSSTAASKGDEEGPIKRARQEIVDSHARD